MLFRSMLLALKAAQEWLEAIDQHEKLVDQDPNYGGYVTSGLIGIMNHRERFRQALAEFQKGESRE